MRASWRERTRNACRRVDLCAPFDAPITDAIALLVWENASPASHRFTPRSSVAVSTAFGFLAKLASAQASRPLHTHDAHHRQLPFTHSNNSCTRVRLIPTRSRLGFRPFETGSLHPLYDLRLFANAIEEPSVSRRQARFGEPVQPAKEFSSSVIRCEPTSDAPVAFVPRFTCRFRSRRLL